MSGLELGELVDDMYRRGLSKTDSISWVPSDVMLTPKQQEFVDNDTEYLLYGGARGSGKSYAALASALKYVDHGEYGCVILRKTTPELEDLIHLSHQWLDPTPAIWNELKKRWTFPSGARLFFGHLQHAADRSRWKGYGQLHAMFFEELDTFDRDDWLSGIENLRRVKGSNIPIRKRGTSNPPTSKGRCKVWVIQDWIIHQKYGEGSVIYTAMDDNPYLDTVTYKRSLQDRDAHDRAALIDGKWDLLQAGRVYPLKPSHMLASMPSLGAPRYFLGFDIGASILEPTTAFCLVCYDQDAGRPLYVVESWSSTEMSDEQYESTVLAYAQKYPNLTCYGDHGALGAKTIRYLQERGLPVLPAEKAQKTYHQGLLRAAFERDEMLVCSGENEELLNHIHALTVDETGTEDKNAVKHLTDAMLYASRPALELARREIPKEPEPETEAERLQARLDKHKKQVIKASRKKRGRYGR